MEWMKRDKAQWANQTKHGVVTLKHIRYLSSMWWHHSLKKSKKQTVTQTQTELQDVIDMFYSSATISFDHL